MSRRKSEEIVSAGKLHVARHRSPLPFHQCQVRLQIKRMICIKHSPTPFCLANVDPSELFELEEEDDVDEESIDEPIGVVGVEWVNLLRTRVRKRLFKELFLFCPFYFKIGLNLFFQYKFKPLQKVQTFQVLGPF